MQYIELEHFWSEKDCLLTRTAGNKYSRNVHNFAQQVQTPLSDFLLIFYCISDKI